MKKILTTAFIVLGLVTHAMAVNPEELVYMTEDYAPYNFEEKGELKGISVDLLKLVWQEMGVKEQPIHLYPWARGYNLVQEKENHVLFAMSRTNERESMFKWVGPIYTVKFVLTGLADKDIKINTIADANKYQIGAIREDVAEQILKTEGIKSIQSMPKMDLNFKKLMAGRIDLIAYSERGIKQFLAGSDLNPDQFKTFFVVKESVSYYAFHKNTPDELINRFQSALDKVRETGGLDTILNRYMP